MGKHDLTKFRFFLLKFLTNLKCLENFRVLQHLTISTMLDNFGQFCQFWQCWQFWQFWQFLTILENFGQFWQLRQFLTIGKTVLETWHLRHWLQFWQLRTWIQTIILTWQLIATLDSILNSCDVLHLYSNSQICILHLRSVFWMVRYPLLLILNFAFCNLCFTTLIFHPYFVS